MASGCNSSRAIGPGNQVQALHDSTETDATSIAILPNCDAALADKQLRENDLIRIVSCAPIEDWDPEWLNHFPSRQKECRIGSVTLSRNEFEMGVSGTFASAIGPTTRWESRALGIGMPLRFSGLRASIGCDETAQRFFVAHPHSGEVEAFTVDGTLLWRKTLPGFLPLTADLPPETSLSLTQVEEQLASGRSIGASLTVVEPYIVVSWRQASQHKTAIYHRSGRLIGLLGPWRAIAMAAPGPRRIRFGLSSSDSVRWESPTRQVVLEIIERRTDLLARHFVAWCLPLSPHEKLGRFKICEGLPASTIAWRLGEDYDETLSTLAKATHDRLGISWYMKTLGRSFGALARLIGSGDPTSPTWEQEIERAALAAGLDADFIAELERHEAVVPQAALDGDGPAR
jgi:sulfur carrier protein ThiS